MGDENDGATRSGGPEHERRAGVRPLKRWRVVVRGTAAALVKELPGVEESDGSAGAHSWKSLTDRRRTA